MSISHCFSFFNFRSDRQSKGRAVPYEGLRVHGSRRSFGQTNRIRKGCRKISWTGSTSLKPTSDAIGIESVNKTRYCTIKNSHIISHNKAKLNHLFHLDSDWRQFDWTFLRIPFRSISWRMCHKSHCWRSIHSKPSSGASYYQSLTQCSDKFMIGRLDRLGSDIETLSVIKLSDLPEENYTYFC